MRASPANCSATGAAAAGVGAFWRRAIDAWNAGYGAQCRLHVGRGARLVRITGHPRFAWDCRRRFIESYAGVVLGVERAQFSTRLAKLVAAEGVTGEQALDSEAIERLAKSDDESIEHDDVTLSDDPMQQLESAAKAVDRSWMSDRARTYRRLEHLDGLRGTAVTVQAMVFGNRGLTSGAGVAFSRDRSTGTAQPAIDVLLELQGEDVVSGSRTPGNRGGDRPFAAGGRGTIARNAGARSNTNSLTCKMSSSPSKTANCGFCRRARRNGRRKPRCGSRSTSSRRD